MSPEKSEKLVEIYPDLFRGNNPRKAFPMFGFECGEGWFDLLKDLITELKAICEKEASKNSLGTGDEVCPLLADQVKEKYGTLRFYTNWTNDDIETAINKAEQRSAITCEHCGAKGEVRSLKSYWYVTYCDDCYNKGNL